MKTQYNANKYYSELQNSKVICVDFDNTICLDEWPYIGPVIPGAIEVLKKLKESGHKLILYTQRHYYYPICCKELEEYSDNNDLYKIRDNNTIDILTPALSVCEQNGIVFDDINKNQKWELATNDRSRKVFMDYLIDDHVMGTQRLEIINKFGEKCKIVNWYFIDLWCVLEGLYEESALNCPYQDFIDNTYKQLTY